MTMAGITYCSCSMLTSACEAARTALNTSYKSNGVAALATRTCLSTQWEDDVQAGHPVDRPDRASMARKLKGAPRQGTDRLCCAGQQAGAHCTCGVDGVSVCTLHAEV